MDLLEDRERMTKDSSVVPPDDVEAFLRKHGQPMPRTDFCSVSRKMTEGERRALMVLPYQ